MASSNIRLSSTPASPASPVVGALQTILANVFGILDVLLRVREIHQNGQKMADMLREADRIQAKSPVRAEALRREAHRIALV